LPHILYTTDFQRH